MTKATYYFRFYLARALEHAGMGDEYLNLLNPWREMVSSRSHNLGGAAGADKIRFARLERSSEF